MDVKDRYITSAMANMFADKLMNKYVLGSGQETDFNLDAWTSVLSRCL